MLAYVLALTVGLGSLTIYMAAFFFPEIHRKNDFIWSGIGLFYAWVLWVCAGRLTGGLLLGQVAGVALLGWSVTQTLSLRRQLTPRLQQTEIPTAAEVKTTLQKEASRFSLPQKLSQLRQRVGGSATAAKDRLQQNLADKVQIVDKRTPIPAQSVETSAIEVVQPPVTEAEEIAPADVPEVVSEPIRPDPPDPELVEAAIRDAEEKHIEASPPETEPENPSPS